MSEVGEGSQKVRGPCNHLEASKPCPFLETGQLGMFLPIKLESLYPIHGRGS